MKGIIGAFLVIFIYGNTLAQQVTLQKDIKVIKLPALQKIMAPKNDTVYVVNFWATWCKPCVQELPYFEKIQANYATKKVKVILVSLDFASEVDKKVKNFVVNKNIQSEVVLLDEIDYNSWINKIEPNWGGGIPVTFIIKKDKKQFIDNEVSYEDLEKYIQSFLNESRP